MLTVYFQNINAGMTAKVSYTDHCGKVKTATGSIGSFPARQLKTANSDPFHSAIANVLTGAQTYLHHNK